MVSIFGPSSSSRSLALALALGLELELALALGLVVESRPTLLVCRQEAAPIHPLLWPPVTAKPSVFGKERKSTRIGGRIEDDIIRGEEALLCVASRSRAYTFDSRCGPGRIRCLSCGCRGGNF